MTFRLPKNTERVAVFGRTGSGKTVFMKYLLSRADIETMPWIILDYKRDGVLGSIPFIHEIGLNDHPRHPGVYRIILDFKEEDEDVDNYLFTMLRKGKRGLFCDEGKNIPQLEPRARGLAAIFAQGRSLKVPVMFGTQRPSWINRSVKSESEYFANFGLQDIDDEKAARKFAPGVNTDGLVEYHCDWYDVRQRRHYTLGPVDEDDVDQLLEDRLKVKTHLL